MRGSFIFWIVIGIALIIAVWLISIYNKIVKRKNHVEDGWSGIDVQLKRRHNLIPNLVKTVKKHASHEKNIMESITNLKNISKTTKKSSASQEQMISTTLSGLMLQIDDYPDLKGDAGFKILQKQLTEVETDIQYARRYFNGAVREYNTLLQTFPALLITKRFGFQEAEFFELEGNDVSRHVSKQDL